jgi:hypothetical protein
MGNLFSARSAESVTRADGPARDVPRARTRWRLTRAALLAAASAAQAAGSVTLLHCEDGAMLLLALQCVISNYSADNEDSCSVRWACPELCLKQVPDTPQ